MLPPISFVVIVKNDPLGFSFTYHSLLDNLDPHYDEIVVVDGSDNATISQLLAHNKPSFVRYFKQQPSGIFGAQNFGVSQSRNPWLWLVNSGDSICHSARFTVSAAFDSHPANLIYVFGQASISSLESVDLAYFYPTPTSLWPHQSIVYNKILHAEMGPYRTDMTFCSDQYFFAQARRSYPYSITPVIVSRYLLGGSSSSISIPYSREIFEVQRMLGHSLIHSSITAWIFPLLRFLLNTLFGRSTSQSLRLSLRRLLA